MTLLEYREKLSAAAVLYANIKQLQKAQLILGIVSRLDEILRSPNVAVDLSKYVQTLKDIRLFMYKESKLSDAVAVSEVIRQLKKILTEMQS